VRSAAPTAWCWSPAPTGSGKTVSLYTCLNILNEPRRQHLHRRRSRPRSTCPASTRSNVNDKAGLTFAAALKSFLRQDPDIIMVGEIRDLETADIAIKAAQPGHMVMSTLHTNDAPTTLTRLMNMGVAPVQHRLLGDPDHRAATRRAAVHLQAARPIWTRTRCCRPASRDRDLDGTWQPFQAGGLRALLGKRLQGSVSASTEVHADQRGDRADYPVQRQRDADRRTGAAGRRAATCRRSGLLKVIQGHTSIEEVLGVTNDDTRYPEMATASKPARRPAAAADAVYQWKDEREPERQAAARRDAGQRQGGGRHQPAPAGASPSAVCAKRRIQSAASITEKDITLFTAPALDDDEERRTRCFRRSTSSAKGAAQRARSPSCFGDIRSDVETGTTLCAGVQASTRCTSTRCYCNLVGGRRARRVSSTSCSIGWRPTKEKIHGDQAQDQVGAVLPDRGHRWSPSSCVAVIMIFVIPARSRTVFSKSFGADLPAPTLAVVCRCPKFFVAYWWLIFGIARRRPLHSSCNSGSARSTRADVHGPASLLKAAGVRRPASSKSADARAGRAPLSTMFAAGVPLVEALDSVGRRLGQPWSTMTATRQIQQRGARPAPALTAAMSDTGRLPEHGGADGTSIGEESGSLDHDAEQGRRLLRGRGRRGGRGPVSSLLEPVIMVILGVIIGGMVVADVPADLQDGPGRLTRQGDVRRFTLPRAARASDGAGRSACCVGSFLNVVIHRLPG
jgi:hypothetical protein